MSQLYPGLVSVTFRQLSPEQIIRLAVQARMQAMEWGGDVHVPPGDLDRARAVGDLTREAGLTVAAYGSYYRVGASPDEDFAPVLTTARVLGAPLIRVWAGARGSQDATDAERAAVVQDARRICERAASEGVSIAFEFHGGTLCDSVDATLGLLSEINHPHLKTLWQPLGEASPAERRWEVERLLPHVANVHVYYWPGGKHTPLAEGKEAWRDCLESLSETDRPLGLLLEFVRDASPEQFLADALTLQTWLR
ncbi:MAG: sugar phosphate isomerase/epimerase [Armatimonadota bacterium]|nr:sugar phosphate isomerase/epimerase [Armatimonadota bacterium]